MQFWSLLIFMGAAWLMKVHFSIFLINRNKNSNYHNNHNHNTKTNHDSNNDSTDYNYR